jgi:CRISPR-associated protein Cas2
LPEGEDADERKSLMQSWVCYDVADGWRRQRLSDVLLDFGTRVQESVFQCLIDPSLAEEMLARIRRTIEENTDKVHVLSLCDACGGRMVLYGIAKQASDPEYLIL